jgi:hypothetical protein
VSTPAARRARGATECAPLLVADVGLGGRARQQLGEIAIADHLSDSRRVPSIALLAPMFE